MASEYRFHQMDDADAHEISGWRYDPPYDFYDRDADPQDLAELRDPERRENVYFSVRDAEERLVGFFQFERNGGAGDVGLGVGAGLTRQGRGVEVVLFGLEFAQGRFGPDRFT